MILNNLVQSFNDIFSRISEWIYSYQNTQHSAGASNYILISLAIGIVFVGLIAEWISMNPGRRQSFLRWWRRWPWMLRLITGYQRTPEKIQESANVDLPTISQTLVVGPDGLTDQQVQERLDANQVNATRQRTSRSYRHIFFTNIFTRFNALLSVVYIIILWVGAPQDSLFGMIIVLNTLIGITQELRAKWTLDRLALVMISQSRVVRNGQVRTIPTNKIVVDDVIELKVGDQVPVDGTVIQSNNLEVNESMVTGESEPVAKQAGDALYSGSFVAAGNGRMQTVHIGEQAYARRLANAVREFTLAKSELRRGINQILRYVTWLLVPTALLLFVTQLLYMQHGWRDALSSSAGGVANMVPDGLVLLTSVVMAIAVISLARRKVLIQELPAVEMLARVDVLCLDKTGTLTEGVMAVEDILPIQNPDAHSETPAVDPKQVLGVFAQKQERTSTLDAIGQACPAPTSGEWDIQESIPFSSARQWSSLTFDSKGTWILGAPEIVLTKQKLALPTISSVINNLAVSGKRVLVLAYSKELINHTNRKSTLSIPVSQPVALIIMQEKLRQGVKKTLQYFREQGVAIKIFSGDSPRTVESVAAAAGIPVDHPQNDQPLPKNMDDLAKLVEQQNVFGRILPEQKKLMVKALQKRGHVVAMVGDGVNDVLAIKEADFSIAMGSGTDSSRGTAQLVLLDNNFMSLPAVIAEGRRIIANIERTANLFITKTAYIMIMALAVGLARTPFPFLPRHLSLLGVFTIGLPALFLSFVPNNTRAHPGFVSRVLRFSLPAGVMIAALTLIVFAITRQWEPANIVLARTSATLTLFGCGFAVLVLLAKPLTLGKKLFLAFMMVGMGLTIGLPSFRQFFSLAWPPLPIWAIIALSVGICIIGLRQINRWLIYAKIKP